MNELTARLLRTSYDNGLLADNDALNTVVDRIIAGVQYFTADEIIELLTENIYMEEEDLF